MNPKDIPKGDFWWLEIEGDEIRFKVVHEDDVEREGETFMAVKREGLGK